MFVSGLDPKRDINNIIQALCSVGCILASNVITRQSLFEWADLRPVVIVVNLFKPHHHSGKDCLTSNHIIVIDRKSYKLYICDIFTEH